MKNPQKYIEDLDSGIFSFDFVQKVFMAAFVWKNILVDHICKPIVVTRRKHLKDKDDKEYRKCIEHIKSFEDRAWESALDKVKKTVQILETNWQKTFNHHKSDPKKNEALGQVEPRANDYFRNYKANITMKMHNIQGMQRREALAL